MTFDGARIKQFPDISYICGWNMVKFLPPISTKWYKGKDRLAGTDVYGDPTQNNAAWSIYFNDLQFDQFKFATNDRSNYKYVIATKKSLLDEFYNSPDDNSARYFLASSTNPNYHKSAKIQKNRKNKNDDPKITITNYPSDVIYA